MDETPHSPHASNEAEGSSRTVTAWLDALDWCCTECGYPMTDLAEPVCPECGAGVTIENLRSALRERTRPQPAEPDPIWRRIRPFGTLSAWVVEAAATGAAAIWVDALDSYNAENAIGAATLSLFAHVVLLFIGVTTRTFMFEARLMVGRSPLFVESRPQRILARLLGLLGAWTTACALMAFPLAVLS